jgi:hypothetical protein
VKFKLATATLGAALILAGAPALASAAGVQSGPIHINRADLSGGNFSNSDGTEVNILPRTAAISFTNRDGATANDVVFALEHKGYVVDTFNDVGSFAPGITINQSFPETLSTGGVRVTVARATFNDGSVWVNPEVSDPLLAQPAVNKNVGVVAMRY